MTRPVWAAAAFTAIAWPLAAAAQQDLATVRDLLAAEGPFTQTESFVNQAGTTYFSTQQSEELTDIAVSADGCQLTYRRRESRTGSGVTETKPLFDLYYVDKIDIVSDGEWLDRQTKVKVTRTPAYWRLVAQLGGLGDEPMRFHRRETAERAADIMRALHDRCFGRPH